MARVVPLVCFLLVSVLLLCGQFFSLAINEEHNDLALEKGDPDLFLNTSALVLSKGYPCEEHTVVTSDGFVLSLQRIPHGKNNKNTVNGPRPVVFLQHGLLDASHSWVINFPHQSLGFILADAGFDVWMGNNRGNTYSRTNVKFNPSTKEFWAWSWDEMGAIDLPTQLNYVLSVSKASSIRAYVGHSQGTVQAFAAFSTNKEISTKVDLYVALAPVAKVGHVPSPLLKALAKVHLDEIFRILGMKEFLPSTDLLKILLPEICTISPKTCDNVLCVLMGCNSPNLNQTRLPVYTSHDPAGTSVQNMGHWAQSLRSDSFQMYDFGSKSANLQHYGQDTPPVYHLENSMVPIALFYGGNDILADVEDVQMILEKVPSRLLVFKQFIQQYDHLDFIWGMDANTMIYSTLLKLLQA